MLNPTLVRMSKHFMLSDMMLSHSGLLRGVPNVFDGDLRDPRLKAGVALAEEVLEPALEKYGSLSVTYGFISDAFSHATIRYQDPGKPSFHRWDNGGAAVDVRLHTRANRVEAADSPLMAALEMATSTMPLARVITYSESPCVCLAHRAGSLPRMATMYEERYPGEPKVKPLHVHLKTDEARLGAIAALREGKAPYAGYEWTGSKAGYPTYHGGGTRQAQHVAVGMHSTLLDWAFDLETMTRGLRNTLPLSGESDDMRRVDEVSQSYDAVLAYTGWKKASIVQGLLHKRHPNFDKQRVLQYALRPPRGEDPLSVLDAITSTFGADTAKRCRVAGGVAIVDLG